MAKITELKFGCVKYDHGRPPLTWGKHRFHYAAMIACVRADDGSHGLGVGWVWTANATPYANASAIALAECVVGKAASLPFRAASCVRTRGRSTGLEQSAALVDLALWDLAGRVQAVPTYQLLGARRSELPVYVTSAEEFSFTSVSQYVELVQKNLENGFVGSKLHLFGRADDDILACQKIRDAVGDDPILMLDPTGRYNARDALKVAHAIEKLGFARFEDPISPESRAEYAWLSKRTSIPLVVNESLMWSNQECSTAAANGIVQGFRSNLGRTGFADALELASISHTHQVELDIAAFAPRGGLEACLHMSLAGPTNRWFEHHTALSLDEVPGIRPGFSLSSGFAKPNDSPGLGFEIDWPQLNKHTQWSA